MSECYTKQVNEITADAYDLFPEMAMVCFCMGPAAISTELPELLGTNFVPLEDSAVTSPNLGAVNHGDSELASVLRTILRELRCRWSALSGS